MEKEFEDIIKKREAKDYSGAIQQCYHVINKFSKEKGIATVYTVLGGMLYDISNYTEAIIILKKAQTLKPDSELISLSIYLSHVSLKNYSLAIEELDIFLSQNKPKMYIDTLHELKTDIENEHAIDFLPILDKYFKKWL